MDNVFCTECGAENPADNAFCIKCGARLDKGFLGDDDASDIHRGDGMDAEVYAEERVFDTGDLGGAPGETTYIPPAPAPAPEPAPAPRPDDGRRRGGTGKIVGITLASVCGVLVAAFAVFYFTNPLGLTTGIFENSAAAQAAAAEQARAEAEAAQQQAEQSQREAEQAQQQAEAAQKAQKEAEQAQRDAEAAQREAEEKAAEKARQQSSSSSSSGSSGTTPSSSGSVYVGPNGIEYTHHVNSEYSDDYILPDSARRLYSVDELSNLSNYELYLARNEIFARYGRMYEESDLDGHYRSTDWYIPLYDGGDFDSVMIEDYLNDNEYKNVIVIRDLERERGSEYL